MDAFVGVAYSLGRLLWPACHQRIMHTRQGTTTDRTVNNGEPISVRTAIQRLGRVDASAHNAGTARAAEDHLQIALEAVPDRRI
jgi:hypothetical protein